MNRSVHSNVVLNNLEALRRYLIRQGQLDRFGQILTAIEPAQPDASGRICLETTSRNIRRIAAIVGDPCLGLELVASQDIGGRSLMAAIDVQLGLTWQGLTGHPLLMLRILERYFRMLTEAADLSCSIDGATYQIVATPYSHIVSHHQTDGVLIAVHRLFSAMSG